MISTSLCSAAKRLAVAALYLSLVVVVEPAKFVAAQSLPSKATLDKTIDDELAKRTADLPQQLGPDLFVVKVERIDTAIVYTAKFTSVDLSPSNELRKQVTSDMVRRACDDRNQRRLMEWGYHFVWLYLDARSSFVARVYVDASKC